MIKNSNNHHYLFRKKSRKRGCIIISHLFSIIILITVINYSFFDDLKDEDNDQRMGKGIYLQIFSIYRSLSIDTSTLLENCYH